MASPKILIVDAEAVVAKELGDWLDGFGYHVVGIASSAVQAIAMTAQTEPNLVLMDIALPGGADGIEAAHEIRRRWHIPIVFLTANTDETTLHRAKLIEPAGYVVKPFTERELRINVEMALYKDEATKRVRELEDRFFEVSLDMLCCLDFNGYFKRLNPAWEKTLGFTSEELLAKPFIEFVHPDDRERTLSQNGKVRTGGHALSFENRYLSKDGSYRWLLWNAAPDVGQKVIYSVARDITERKQADEEREKLVRELRAALVEVKTLQGILPICSYCKRIRDDEDYWHGVEAYISDHTNTRFSHSICPSCYETQVEPQFAQKRRE